MAYQKIFLKIIRRLGLSLLILALSLPWQGVTAQSDAGLADTLTQGRTGILADDEPAILKIVVPPGPYAINQEIIVSVELDTPANTRGVQFGLTFNPGVLQCLHGDEGTFYNNWASQNGGSTSVYPEPKCYNTGSKAGRVSDIAISIMGGASGGPSGVGVVATYTFKIIGDGLSPLDFLNISNDVPLLYDDSAGSSTKELPLSTLNAHIQVGPTPTPSPTFSPSIVPFTPSSTPSITPTALPPSERCLAADINGDGAINIGDLSVVGNYWTETGTPGWIPADVNKDGAVDIGDLMAVSDCWAGSQPEASATPLSGHSATPTPSPANTQTPTGTATTAGAPTLSATASLTAAGSAATLTGTPSPTTNATTKTAAATPTFTTDAQLRVEPALQTVGVGQEFEVSVLLNTKKSSRGAQTNLTWDPEVVQLLSFKEGNFFSSWAAAWNTEHPDDEADIGMIPKAMIGNGTLSGPQPVMIAGASSDNSGHGPSGSGTLLVFKFKGKKIGNSQIHLLTTEVIDVEKWTDAKGRQYNYIMSVTNVDGEVVVSDSAPALTETASLTPGRTNTTSPGGGVNNTATATRTITVVYDPQGTAVRTNTPGPAVPTIESAARVGFNPPQTMVTSPGGTFTVEVAVNADKPVRGASVEIKFNPSILECESVEEGDFLKNWAAQNSASSMIFPSFKIDNAAGTILNGAVILVGTNPPGATHFGGATGISSLVKLTFKAKAVGVSQLTVTDAKLIDDSPTTGQYAVARDIGEVFVGVTPTATLLGAPTATGGAGNYSSNKTATITGAGAGSKTGTVTPGGSGGDGMIKTPGIKAPGNAIEIPVTAGDDPNQIIGSLLDLVDTNGILKKDIILRSPDKLFAIYLPEGVQALTEDNYPLPVVTITRTDQTLEEGSSFQLLSTVYNLGPAGSVLNPPVKIIFAYNPAELPEGVVEEDLVVGYYNPDKKQWESLESELDKEAGTVTASIEHFSVYALLARPPAFRMSWVTGGVVGFLILLGGAVFLTLWLKKRSLASGVDIVSLLPSGPIGLLEQGSTAAREIIDATASDPTQSPMPYPDDDGEDENVLGSEEGQKGERDAHPGADFLPDSNFGDGISGSL